MKQREITWLLCALATVPISPLAAQTTEVVLHNFGVFPGGANPYAGVIRDSAGNLYGTTYYGGAAGAGVVYKLDMQLGQELDGSAVGPVYSLLLSHTK
jgi:uncharacterized repeat protein (TIGR03803 family)